jgi:hypothetical protein
VNDPARLYLTLTLEQRAVTLDTATGYNTWQLTAMPRDGRDEAMTGLPAPTFRLRTADDSTRLRVTPNGSVTALKAGTNINVIAELTVPGPGGYPVRHADTARVTVKTQVPQLVPASLSIDPIPPDSAELPLLTNGLGQALGFVGPTTLKPVALDAAGQSISGLVIEYVSLDPAIATVDRWTGQMLAYRPGEVRMVARTAAYGVRLADTALFAVVWPVEDKIEIRPKPGGAIFVPSEIRIVPYGVIAWANYLSDSADVVFEDPTHVEDPANGSAALVTICTNLESFLEDSSICAVGNMLIRGVLPEDPIGFGLTFRQFPVPGVYNFRSIRTGATGRLVVTDEIPLTGTTTP